MSIQQSTKKHDAGRIPGPANNPNVMEMQLGFSLPNGKIIHGSLHGFATPLPAPTVALANTLFGVFSSAWLSNLGPYMHTGTVLVNLAIRDMSSFTNPVFYSTSAGVVGTGAGAAMPESNAIVLTENVNVRGRGAKGRLYLSGWVTSADVTSGGISTTVQAAINTMGTSWLSGINSNGLTACVSQLARAQYMGYTGTVHPARPAGHATVTGYVCRDLVWDTQRRRVQA